MSHCIHKSVATAPGKAILFGEHAVVFGTMAVAGALSDMRISAETSTVVGSEELVVILEDILDESTMAATVVHVDFKTIRSILSKHEDPFQPTNPTEEVKKSLKSLFANTYAHAVCQGMMSIVYLVANLLGSVVWSDDTVGICMRIQSKGLPIGAGLGSSASVSVAVAASCLRLQALCQPSKCSRDELIINSCSVNAASVDDGNSGGSSDSSSSSSSSIGKGVSTATLVTPAKELLEVINDWAYASEILLHGQPSGLDNTTSCFGGLVQFSRRAEERFQLVARPPPLHILLVNTRVPRSTKKLVGAVRELHDRHPAVIQPILDSIHKIAEKFLSLISTFQANGHVESGSAYNDLITETGNLMEVNHHLLCGLGVGHPALSDVHDAAAAAAAINTTTTTTTTTTSTSVSSAAAVPAAIDGDSIASGEKPITSTTTAVTKGFACKLTGAGGGGCAIILSPVPYCEEDDIYTSTSTGTSSGGGGGRGSCGETHTATIHTSQSTSCNSCSKSNVVLGGSGEGDVGGHLRRLRLLVASLRMKGYDVHHSEMAGSGVQWHIES